MVTTVGDIASSRASAGPRCRRLCPHARQRDGPCHLAINVWRHGRCPAINNHSLLRLPRVTSAGRERSWDRSGRRSRRIPPDPAGAPGRILHSGGAAAPFPARGAARSLPSEDDAGRRHWSTESARARGAGSWRASQRHEVDHVAAFTGSRAARRAHRRLSCGRIAVRWRHGRARLTAARCSRRRPVFAAAGELRQTPPPRTAPFVRVRLTGRRGRGRLVGRGQPSPRPARPGTQ